MSFGFAMAAGGQSASQAPEAETSTNYGRDVPPPIPNVAISYYPDNCQTGVSTTATLSWDYEGPPIIGYRVYLGSDYAPTNIADGLETCCCQLPLVNLVDPDTQYYWRIVPYNEYGEAVGCPVLSFHTAVKMTGLPVPYWEPVDFCCLHNLPVGWLACDGDGSGCTWQMACDPGFTGEHSLHLNSNQRLAVDDWLISPPLELSHHIIYRFWTMVKAGDTACESQVRIYFGSSPDPLSLIDTGVYTVWCVQGSWYQLMTFDVAPNEDGVYYFGIHALGQDLQSDLWVDDILVYDYAVPADDEALPPVTRPAIRAIYPNPFSSGATVEYETRKTGEVSIEIFNLRGQKVCTVESGIRGPGSHKAAFKLREAGLELPAGIYLCKFRTSDHSEVQRILFTGNQR